MTSTQVALVPSNLARPPVQWSAQEVKAWLEFCVQEFSLSPVCVDKFDMNGKALLLLTRTDFLERAPHAGDVLFNAFQRLLLQDTSGPAYLRSPVLIPATTTSYITPPATDILSRQLMTQSPRAAYISIRPQPQILLGPTTTAITCPISNSLKGTSFVLAEDNLSLGHGVPASMLSPDPSEKCASDTDSTHNESGLSPNTSDLDMDCDESMNFDPGRDLKADMEVNDDGVCRLLWEFIYQLLQEPKWSELVRWESEEDLTFCIRNPTSLAEAWGKQKNRSNMTYEKLSRALRYYYKMNIIKKVPGRRLTYKFLQHPTTIRKGQRGAKPHSSRTLAARAAEAELTNPETTLPNSTYPSAHGLLPSSSTSSALSGVRQSHTWQPERASSTEAFQQLPDPNESYPGHVPRQHFYPTSPERSHEDSKSFFYPRERSIFEELERDYTKRSLSASPRHSEFKDMRLVDLDQKYESRPRSSECLAPSLCSLDSFQVNQLKSTVGPKCPSTSSFIFTDGRNSTSHPAESHSHREAFLSSHYSSYPSTSQDLVISDNYYAPTVSLTASSSPAPTDLKTLKQVSSLTSAIHDSDSRLSLHRDRYHPYASPQTVLYRTSSPHRRELEDSLPSHINPTYAHNHLRKHATTTYHSAPDIPSHIQHERPYFENKAFKQEDYELEQSEPEDLSVRTRTRKESSCFEQANKEGSCLKQSPVPEIQENTPALADSPGSCSGDSAYGSDRADISKDCSTLEPVV